MLNVCLICSALLIVKVISVITVFFFFVCVSTILVNKDDHIFTGYRYFCVQFYDGDDVDDDN